MVQVEEVLVLEIAAVALPGPPSCNVPALQVVSSTHTQQTHVLRSHDSQTLASTFRCCVRAKRECGANDLQKRSELEQSGRRGGGAATGLKEYISLRLLAEEEEEQDDVAHILQPTSRSLN